MTGTVLFFGAAALAVWLLFTGMTAVRRTPKREPLPPRGATSNSRKETEAEALPRLVRQLAALLAAGRTGPELWGVLAHVVAAEPHNAGTGRRWLAAGKNAAEEAGNTATVTLLLVVQRANVLGLSSAAAIRNACAPDTSKDRRRVPSLSAGQRQMWLEIAACLEVCEASGAPVGAVLNRLATTMEADFDAAALRETALAGPRATVRLLGWLPFVGLGLGMAMGVDPLAILFGSPAGWTVLAAGIAFTVVGRMWSSALIAQAAGPAGRPSRRAHGIRGPVNVATEKTRR
ncbi:type II secretion system F family protein [Arthrobacter sp. Sr24]